MRVEIARDPGLASALAARFLLSSLASARTVALAAGNTPLDCYRRIAATHPALPGLHVFVLDEYLGVPASDPRTCSNLLRAEVAAPWGVTDDRFHTLPTGATHAARAIVEHESAIARRGLDLAVLGVGRNGHVGFNEPGSEPVSQGRVVDLEPGSTDANRAWFSGDFAPSRGVTLGLATILGARRVAVLAFGEAKAAAVARMLDGRPALDSPASWLHSHADVTLFLDEAAASALTEGPGRTL